MIDLRAIFGVVVSAGAAFAVYKLAFTENLEGSMIFVIPAEDAAYLAGVQDGDEIDLPGNIKVNGDDFESGAAGAPDISPELTQYNQDSSLWTSEPIEFDYYYETNDDYNDWGGYYDYWG